MKKKVELFLYTRSEDQKVWCEITKRFMAERGPTASPRELEADELVRELWQEINRLRAARKNQRVKRGKLLTNYFSKLKFVSHGHIMSDPVIADRIHQQYHRCIDLLQEQQLEEQKK